MEIIQNLGAIVKIVIMPTSGAQTIFQGFDGGIISPEVSGLLFLLGKVPAHVTDIFESEKNEGGDKTLQRNPIFLISKENIENIEYLFSSPFCVLFCTARDLAFTKHLSKRFTFPPIICSDIKGASIKASDVKSIYAFDNLIYSQLKFLEEKLRVNGERKISLGLKRRQSLFKPTRLGSKLHNVTLSNELLIESMGFMLSKPKKLKKGSSRREFIDQMIEGVDAYNECLTEMGKDGSGEIILFAPGMFSFYKSPRNTFFDSFQAGLNNDQRRFLIDGVLRNPDYSSIGFHLEDESIKTKDLENHPKIKPLLMTRRHEMLLTTAAISVLSFNKKSPAIRLPNSVNHLAYKLKNLENLVVSDGIHNRDFIRKAKAFNTILRRTIGSKLRRFIVDNYNDVSFVCDVPLDWVRFDNLPIMLTHEISRINTTPGNVLLQSTSEYPRVMIHASEMKKILIIRSFEPGDPIKFHLERALDQFKKHMPDLQCTLIDVNTKEQFIDSLNSYDGHIVIVDCHGNHGGELQSGWLNIGEERVDTWHLRQLARVPPIVILSACLTSALSGSHASVANGFLVSGAISIIGTLLPVKSIESAIFVSRLIYRFYQFPSAIPKKYSHMNMRLFISLFLRMSYVSDVFRGFCSMGLLDADETQDENVELNTHINMLNPNWNDVLVESISKMSGIEHSEVERIIARDFFITETMCYSQIGFPEAITIDLRS